MRKVIIFICLIAFLSVSNVAYAYNALTKLGRGALNTVTCPFELVNQPKKMTDDKGILVGMTIGVFKGFMATFVRGIIGICEVVTFPLPSYKPIMTDPDSVLDWKL